MKKLKKNLGAADCNTLKAFTDSSYLTMPGNTWELRGNLYEPVNEIIERHGFDPARSSICRKGRNLLWYIQGEHTDAPGIGRPQIFHLDIARWAQFSETYSQVEGITGRWWLECPWVDVACEAGESVLADLRMIKTGLRVGRCIDDPNTGYLYGIQSQATKNLQEDKKSDIIEPVTEHEAVAILKLVATRRGQSLSDVRALMRDNGYRGKLDIDEHGKLIRVIKND